MTVRLGATLSAHSTRPGGIRTRAPASLVGVFGRKPLAAQQLDGFGFVKHHPGPVEDLQAGVVEALGLVVG